ncbi:MAG: GFA family protein [Caulobacteraceae bacterium]|nr:GFA family protein [Caulobacteraceae bacterium]
MSDEIPEGRAGGCLCGQVRYIAPAQFLSTIVCHCANCQKQAGSAFSVVAVLPREALKLKGELTVFEDRGTSGAPVWRNFCGRCGSPVITDTPQARERGLIFLKAGTLDDPSDLAPTIHAWTRSRQPWMQLPEGVEVLAEQ